MGRKVLKILSLQEYGKKKRKKRVEFLDYEACCFCEFYRKENKVCLGGNKITKLKNISFCPISKKFIKQLHT